jgi:hypothetical protein
LSCKCVPVMHIIHTFSGVFSKPLKATVSFVMSVCLSVCLSVCPLARKNSAHICLLVCVQNSVTLLLNYLLWHKHPIFLLSPAKLVCSSKVYIHFSEKCLLDLVGLSCTTTIHLAREFSVFPSFSPGYFFKALGIDQ